MKFWAIVGIAVVGLPAALVAGVLAALWRAWWLHPAWAWYIEPLGVKPVTIWHFMAFILLVKTLTEHKSFKKDDRKFDWAESIASVTVVPIIIWALLWWMQS